MVKLNKLAFRKAIALTVGYILFMLITKLLVKEPQILKIIVGVLISSVLVGLLFYFVFSWKDKRVGRKSSSGRINN